MGRDVRQIRILMLALWTCLIVSSIRCSQPRISLPSPSTRFPANSVLAGGSALARILVLESAKSQMRLRGGRRLPAPWRPPDGSEPEVVNLVPEPMPLPTEEEYEATYGSPKADEAIARAEEALQAGSFDDARKLHLQACVLLTESGGVGLRYDQLRSLERRIGWAQGNATLAQKELEAGSVELPYWNVSNILNLTKAQVDVLEGWIGRPLDPSKALYVASRDGWTCRDFHNMCDDRGPTVTIVRTETGHVFGGYTSVSWSKGTFKMRPPRWEEKMIEDTTAFVFRIARPKGWRGKSWDEIFGVSLNQVLEPFFEKQARADLEAAKAAGFPGPDVFHYDHTRGKVQIGQTADGRREVTAFDEETELARLAEREGRVYMTVARAENQKQHNEESMKARAELLDRVYGADKKKENAEDEQKIVLMEDEDDDDSEVPSRSRNNKGSKADKTGNRWGLDVKVPGIRNQTGLSANEAADQQLVRKAEATVFGGVPFEQGEVDEFVDGEEFIKCAHSGLNQDIPRIRHAWCIGPTWTHALEIDLDNTRNCFSDMLAGALFQMPVGVSSNRERLMLAGKIGGRTIEEKEQPDAVWDVEEVAVIAV